jgi:hypothetical protein
MDQCSKNQNRVIASNNSQIKNNKRSETKALGVDVGLQTTKLETNKIFV